MWLEEHSFLTWNVIVTVPFILVSIFFAISWMQDVIIKRAVSSAAELLTICSFAMEANEHVNTNKKY